MGKKHASQYANFGSLLIGAINVHLDVEVGMNAELL